MALYKNTSGHALEVPALELRIPVDGTFEVPDEVAHSFDNSPFYAKSSTKSPDQVVDAQAAAAVTGSIPVLPPPTLA